MQVGNMSLSFVYTNLITLVLGLQKSLKHKKLY